MALAFGAGTGTINPGGVLQSRSENSVELSIADALDEFGDIAERTYYGLTDIKEVTEVYALDNGSFTLPTLGLYNSNIIITSIEVSTSNSDWPQISITFMQGIPAAKIETGTATMPSISVEARRKAQPLLLTGGVNLQSTSVSFSIDLEELRDASGEQCKFAFMNARWEANAEALDGTFSASGSNAHLDSNGVSTSNTAYGTKTGKASGYISMNRGAS